MPTKAEKPVPNSDSASPEAYWLVLSQMTSTPKAAAIRAPAPMPAAKAIQSLPVCTPAANPATAATSIMPSAPRLTMPARSLMSSPSAAMASTVPALSEAATSRAKVPMVGPSSGPARQARAVVDQRVAGQQREPQQALEHAGQRLGQAQARLRQFAADVEHAHQHRRKDDAHRVQPPHEGDDDGREAVAHWHVGRDLAQRAGRLEAAGQAGHAARQQQRRPERRARREARVARRRRRQAAHRQLEAA